MRNIRIADLNGLAVPIPTDHTYAIAVNALKAINEKTVEIQRLEVERAQLLADSLEEISKTGDLFGV